MDTWGFSNSCPSHPFQSHLFLDIYILPTANTYVLSRIWPSCLKSMCALDNYTGVLPLTVFAVPPTPAMYNIL